MREDLFKKWMIEQGTMTKRPMGDAVSRCRRIERDLDVDLDKEYGSDRGIGLINLLEYSLDDARYDRPLPGRLVLNGSAENRKNSMASLKGAVKKYFIFCCETK